MHQQTCNAFRSMTTNDAVVAVGTDVVESDSLE